MNAPVAQQLREILWSMQSQVIALVPRLLAALILVALAFIVAAVVERLLRAGLVRLRFDGLLHRTGVDQWLHRIGIRKPMNDFLPRITYFLLLFAFARSTADLLGLTAVSAGIGSVLVMLPRVLVALTILLIGGAIAAFVGNAVRELSQNLGVGFARSLGSAVSLITMIVLVMMALDQVGIDTAFVRLVVGIVFAGAALAAALALGLGARDVARSMLAGHYARQAFRVGSRVEVSGTSGTLVGFTPTMMLLESDGRTIAVPNRVFLEEVVSQ